MKQALILILAAPLMAQYVTSLGPQFEQQFHDNSGNPLAGGSVTTYQAGTTTPLATYTNNTLSTANANPVVLDSAGRANIWLLPQAYKFVLKNSAGTTIKTVDNVIDIGMALKRDLADTSSDSLNSAMIGFKPPGGSARTVRQELITLGQAYGFLATSYGATGDGTTDDTSAIQDCIDAAAAVGGACYLPPGTYGITDPLVMRTNTTLLGATIANHGDGPATAIKSLAGWNKTSGDALVKNDNTYSWGSSIRRLNLVGNATTGPDYGIYYMNGNSIVLEDILVDTTRLDGIYLDNNGASLFQTAVLNHVTAYNTVLNSSLSARHGALRVNWTDVHIDGYSGFYTSSEASYSESGKRVACLFEAGSDNGAMVNSECSHSEIGMYFETGADAWRISSSRAQFNAGDGVVIAGAFNNFSAFQVQYNGRSAGTFYGFNVSGQGNTFTGTSLLNSCPSSGCQDYAYRFTNTNNPPNKVFGHTGEGDSGTISTTDPTHVMWENLRQAVSGAYDEVAGTVDVADSNFVILGNGTSGAYTLDTLTGGKPGQTVTFVYSGNADPPTISATTNLKLMRDWTGFNPGAFPNSSLTIHTYDGTNWYEINRNDWSSGVGQSAQQLYDSGETSGNRIWESISNTGSQQLLNRACNDDRSTCTNWAQVARSGSTAGAVAFPTRIVAGAAVGSADSTAALTLAGGARSIGVTFANLGTVLSGSSVAVFVWCSDCTVAATCTGSGTGAWAFHNSAGVWKCPF